MSCNTNDKCGPMVLGFMPYSCGSGESGSGGSNAKLRLKVGEEVLDPTRLHIDGKPLYLKLIDLGAAVDNTSILVPHGITGFEYIQIADQHSIAINPNTSTLDDMSSVISLIAVNRFTCGTNVHSSSGTLKDLIQFTSTSVYYSKYRLYICVEYTKAADQPVE